MSTVVLVTQRVDMIVEQNEKRDALDQRLIAFLETIGLIPLPVPNNVELAITLFKTLPINGLVLSGGNDLAAFGGDAPERDATERELLFLANSRNLPILGICRGMQFLVHEAGGKLTRIADHAATRHTIHNTDNNVGVATLTDVNSFHQWAVRELPSDWIEQARSTDNTIEMARSISRKHLGIMWHPEREPIFSEFDIQLVREHFTVNVSS